MIPGGGRGLVVAAALLMPAPCDLMGQQPRVPTPVPTPAQQGGAQPPQRLGRPFPVPLTASRQQQGTAALPQGATGGPQRLGRGMPGPAQPRVRAEPGCSVSIVSPHESTVFGRRQRSGNQSSLRQPGGAGGAGMNQMGR